MKLPLAVERVVAAGLRPAVEGGILPPGFAFGVLGHKPAGQDAQRYGRPEARRYLGCCFVALGSIPVNVGATSVL